MLSSSQNSEEVRINLKREAHYKSSNGSQTDTQIMSDTLDPDDHEVPHQISPSSSDTVLLDLNENEVGLGKEISNKIVIFSLLSDDLFR